MKLSTNFKNSITPRNIFKLILLIALISLSIWGVFRLWFLHQYITINKHNPNEHLFDFWNMFWTFITALAVPGALLGFVLKQAKEEKSKKQEEKKEDLEKSENMITEMIPNFWQTTAEYHLDESSSAFRNSVIRNGISILLSYSRVYNKDKLDENNEIYPYIYFVSKELRPLQNFIPDFFNFSDIINSILDDDDQSEDIKTTNRLSAKNVLIVRTVRTDPSDNDILGDWLISKRNAKNIKYVIGVFGHVNTSKNYIKAIPVETFDVIDNKRIRFKPKAESDFFNSEELLHLLKDIDGNEKTTSNIKTLVEDIIAKTYWKGINPTVFLSHLEYLLSQLKMYKAFEDGFLQKISEYNTQNKDSNGANLQFSKDFSKTDSPVFFRIRFRSEKLDTALPEKNQQSTYNDYSHWYEIISDNNHDEFIFASVFFANKTAENNSDANQIFDNKQLNEFYNYKKSGKKVKPFEADDENKNGYIIEVGKLSQSEVTDTDKEPLNSFIASIFKAIEEDIKFFDSNAN